MAKSSAADKLTEIQIVDLELGEMNVALRGKSPLIFNAMSEKAKRELLMPKGRKTRADRAASLKHQPLQEYRNSVYRQITGGQTTRLVMPAPAFKGAMCTAALDLPGTRKSEIGRLVWIPGINVPIFGVPQLLMSVVRSADLGKTPDIRTRAILKEWCCIVPISFVRPMMNADSIGRLMAAAGMTAGIGDFRQERGKGSFGQFEVTNLDDPVFQRIMQEGGREAQDAALESPECFDSETENLIAYYDSEILRMRVTSVVKEAA